MVWCFGIKNRSPEREKVLDSCKMLPDQVGFMVLEDGVLFPQALLRLYIFEPRYRAMLKSALETHRMFAVAPPDPKTGDKGSPYRVAGIGLIRACVDQPDGTSNLVLEGFSRVRVKRFVQDDPFYIGEIEQLVTEKSEPLESDALALKLLEIMSKMHQSGEIQAKGLMQFLTDIKDHETLADIISYSFIEDSSNKQLLLETLSLRERLHQLVKILLAQSGEAPPQN